MGCRYQFQGKTYTAWEFDDVLRAMAPAELLPFLPPSVHDIVRGVDVVAPAAGTLYSQGERVVPEAGRLGAFLKSSAPKLSAALSDIFNTRETFNWLHKSVGTQHHKASLDSDFKRVYESAMSFENDVSRLANEAADFAPDLIPRMDGLRETMQTARRVMQDAKDSRAISSWVFYGTLAERVFTDEELRNPQAVRTRYGDLLPASEPLQSLSTRQIDLYRQFQNATSKSLDDLAASEMARLAKISKLEVAPEGMPLADTARFYFDQFAGELERQMTALEEMKEAQAEEMNALEASAKDGIGAEWGQQYVELVSNTKARHAADRQLVNNAIADMLRLKDAFIGKAETISKLKANGYAPLMRFGRYTVDVVMHNEAGEVVKDAEGNEERPFFGMFETEAEANAVARELAEEFPGYSIEQGILSEHQSELFAGVAPENLQLYAEMAGFEADEAFQKYLKLATANRSAMKRMIHRKGTAGFSFDATRTLASFITSNARAASSNLHMGDMLRAVSDIPKGKGDVKDEAIKLMQYVRSPSEAGSTIRSFLFFQYLGGSVASALVNMTQSLTTTFPYLSQYTTAADAGTQVLAAMKAATSRMYGGSTGDTAMDAILKRAEEEGIVAPQEIHMIQGEASRGDNLIGRNPLWRALENKYPALRYTSRLVHAGMSLWGAFFSLAEQYNRQVSFVAAYRIAIANGKTAEQAYAFASESVTETQFNYAKSARSNWGRNPVGAVVLTFKTFLVNYVELGIRLAKNDPKAALIMLGMLILLAGTQGAPGADDLDDVIDTLGQAMGYSTNAKRWKQEALQDLFGGGEFGRAAAGFIQHGVSYITPLDLSGRLSVGNIIPATSLLKKSDQSATDDIGELLGPAAGLAKTLHGAAQAAMGGAGALETLATMAAPKAITDVAKAVDMAQSGIYRDTHGRRVVDVSTADAVIKAFGFQPNSVAIVRRAERMVQQDIALFRAVKMQAAEQWARGVFERDPEKVESAKEALRDWNDKNPGLPMRVKLSQVQRRVSEMKKLSGDRMASSAPTEIRGNVRSVLNSGELE